MAAPRKHPPQGAAADTERLASDGHSAVGIAKHFGVSRDTFKRWCNEIPSILEAFEVGRERERQFLHSLIVEAAKNGKAANANAMFLLKARHGYREFDSPHSKVDVSVQVAQPVMIVKDHGTNEEWQKKLIAQQRSLIESDSGETTNG
jgi:hypothetical protein